MRHRRRGFTVLELMVVVVVGAALSQMAIKGFGYVRNQVSAREARTVFGAMVARTRAQAIESGQRTLLIADAQGDSVMILANGGVVETIRFGKDLGIDIQGPPGMTRICMTPRGYANPDCNSFSSPIKLAFVQGPKSDTVEVLPLGQIRW